MVCLLSAPWHVCLLSMPWLVCCLRHSTLSVACAMARYVRPTPLHVICFLRRGKSSVAYAMGRCLLPTPWLVACCLRPWHVVCRLLSTPMASCLSSAIYAHSTLSIVRCLRHGALSVCCLCHGSLPDCCLRHG